MAPKKHRQHLPSKSAPTSARGASSHRAAAGYSGGHWVYGWHAVNAALANPERVVIRIIASPAAGERLTLPARKLPTPHIMEPRELDRILGSDAVHQGIAAEVKPLEPYRIEDVLNIENPRGPILILDQVSDPHNVGAIMRSAAAYDAIAVIYPKDHSAPETPAMAKAASGALDLVKRIQVTNLATAMRELKDAGWWIIGLEGESSTLFNTVKFAPKTVIVLGAEGKGMRRLTADCCDERARLPMGAGMESLNVSNAAAIALYQLYLARPRHG
ncbi:MAG: 23S rRNA (guanosine(2251)-2'-O)-methyltransferase RlmB [Alphaproteobacteria bacterium]|nr:23S rRNA (guanosine(2251)-2'-O)-methyltransferase RlmB [Alphaproteobacteria bacterium]